MITERPSHAIETLSDFLSTPLDDSICRRLADDAEEHALKLFRMAVDTVPAYGRFLEAHHVRPDLIRSFADFQRLPLVNKANYMHAYPLPDRCKGGSLAMCDKMAVSSGSTGTPTFWPRTVSDELDVALRFEQVFRNSFRAHERTTLAVVCFPLGNWVGGIYTASCCWYLTQKGYPITVATPGNNVAEILRVVAELGPHFEQTALLGYPPFVKDVIAAGRAQGVDWPRLRLKLAFAGEVFTEEWRALLGKQSGSDAPCHDSASLYGTADAGVLGNETPVSIAIRRFLSARPDAARELFGESRLPTLVQYDPMNRFFEVVDGTLVVSGDSGVPLVRYHIADRGGIMSYGQMRDFLQKRGVASLREYGLEDSETMFPLPFVWVFGRADFTVSFYGANIYPENVAVGLEQQEISGWVTGKFVMETRVDDEGSEFLKITVELLPGMEADGGKEDTIALSVQTQLLRLNSEFANYAPAAKQRPIVALRPFGDGEYFPVGIKHRYTRR